MTEPEFSRPVRIDTLGAAPRVLRIEASPDERAALARRFDLVRLDRLEAEVEVTRETLDIVASGTLHASATQACVVTGEPVEQAIVEPFRILFRPEPTDGAEEEVEIGDEDLDVVFYEGALVDVGEASAQTLALALDPFPRAPGAEQALAAADAGDGGETGPFAALKALRGKPDA